jgi:hypothetical protein
MDVCRQEGPCSAGSAQFESVRNRRDLRDVTNVLVSRVLSLTSFHYPWGKRSFCGQSRTGEPTEQNNGFLLKRNDIDVLNVDRNCFEEPGSVVTAKLQWMWIDSGG